MKISYPNTYIVWDLETSGLEPERAKVLEIGALKVIDGNIVERRNWVLNHGIEIPSEITALTGITKEIIDREGTDPKEAVLNFFEYLGRGVPHITHNGLRFDIPFITTAGQQLLGWSPSDTEGFIVTMNRLAIDTAAIYKAQKLGAERKYYENFVTFARRMLEQPVKGLKYNVAVCCDELGIDRTQVKQHRAMGDIELTHAIYQKLLPTLSA